MKKLVTLLLFIILASATGCASSSTQVARFETQTKPFSVNFLYEKGADMRTYTLYYVKTGHGTATDAASSAIASLVAQHSFDGDDQKNLEKSIIQTLLLSKPFKQINVVSSREEMKSKEAKYDIVVTYFGSSIGGRWTVKILLGYQIIDKAQNKVIFSKAQLIEESSMMKNLNGVKNACIQTALKSLFEYLNKAV
jgi:hypothetical protein